MKVIFKIILTLENSPAIASIFLDDITYVD